MRTMIDPLGIGRAWVRAGSVGPPVDVYETEDSLIVRMAVPGAEGTRLNLSVEQESITVRGESPVPGAHWGERTVVHWQEIPYGMFERTVPLPGPIVRDGARAQYKNGVLEVTLPKQRPRDVRTIQIDIT
jgi:HSP20 family protein